MGGVDVNLPEAKEREWRVEYEMREQSRKIASFQTEIRNVRSLVILVFALSFVMWVSLVLVSFSIDCTSHDYVDEEDSFLFNKISKQQDEIISLTVAINETQLVVQRLYQNMVDQCVVAFTENYVAEHPSLVDISNDVYLSTLMNDVRTQALRACTTAD